MRDQPLRYHRRPVNPTPSITSFALGEFQTNCHVVSVAGSDACWIVDVGYQPERLFRHVEEARLRPTAIVLTHCHCDHVAGLDAALRRFGGAGPLPVIAHEAERGFCSQPELNLSAFLGEPVSVSEPTRWLRGGETLELAGTRWRVLHTPGHSPGGITLLHEPTDGGAPTALVGDTLFAGSIGRIDFPTSDGEAMARTLGEVLLALPDATGIFPGHGPATTIGRERRTNPFLRDLGALTA